MPRLYACIISDDVKQRRETLIAIAGKFSHSIRVLEDGVLFDVSGLERLIGRPERIAQEILTTIRQHNIPGNAAVAGTVESAMLIARQPCPDAQAVHLPDTFEQLSLGDLNIDPATLKVFEDLGLRRVKDLLSVPKKELIDRYGTSFQDVIDTIEQKGKSFLIPNVKESNVSWSFDLNQPVENFEQLIFVANHGLERLFAEITDAGLSCEHIDLSFSLKNKSEKAYEVKTSFPTLERVFWLKLVNLRIALDPPEADIVSIKITAHFTKARAAQRGLYAVSRPEPESLLLTVNKLKKLVGEANVGIPVLLNQRITEPFTIDADALPEGRENISAVTKGSKAVIAFTYFRPAYKCHVELSGRRLTHLRTRLLSGEIVRYSGVWRANSKWWERPWATNEWDVEIKDAGVYRLRKTRDHWLLIGEYD